MGVCAITKQKMLDKYEALGFNKYFIIIGVLGWWWPEFYSMTRLVLILLDNYLDHNLQQLWFFFLQENDLLIGEFVFQSNQSRCWKESKDIPTSSHVCGEGSCTGKLGKYFLECYACCPMISSKTSLQKRPVFFGSFKHEKDVVCSCRVF